MFLILTVLKTCAIKLSEAPPTPLEVNVNVGLKEESRCCGGYCVSFLFQRSSYRLASMTTDRLPATSHVIKLLKGPVWVHLKPWAKSSKTLCNLHQPHAGVDKAIVCSLSCTLMEPFVL